MKLSLLFIVSVLQVILITESRNLESRSKDKNHDPHAVDSRQHKAINTKHHVAQSKNSKSHPMHNRHVLIHHQASSRQASLKNDQDGNKTDNCYWICPDNDTSGKQTDTNRGSNGDVNVYNISGNNSSVNGDGSGAKIDNGSKGVQVSGNNNFDYKNNSTGENKQSNNNHSKVNTNNNSDNDKKGDDSSTSNSNNFEDILSQYFQLLSKINSENYGDFFNSENDGNNSNSYIRNFFKFLINLPAFLGLREGQDQESFLNNIPVGYLIGGGGGNDDGAGGLGNSLSFWQLLLGRGTGLGSGDGRVGEGNDDGLTGGIGIGSPREVDSSVRGEIPEMGMSLRSADKKK